MIGTEIIAEILASVHRHKRVEKFYLQLTRSIHAKQK